MRKLLSILLLALLAFTSVAPLFALEGGTNVPACCRGDGAHKCMRMSMQGMMHEQADDDLPRIAGLRAKCPFSPASVVSYRTNVVAAPRGMMSLDRIAAHLTGVAQTESRYRVARDRSRQKRGPPSFAG